MAFDIAGARKSGYSDTEIADHLAESRGFDTAGARKAGYSDSDIVGYLGGSSPKPTAWESVKDVAGQAVDAVTGAFTPDKSVAELASQPAPVKPAAPAQAISPELKAGNSPITAQDQTLYDQVKSENPNTSDAQVAARMTQLARNPQPVAPAKPVDLGALSQGAPEIQPVTPSNVTDAFKTPDANTAPTVEAARQNRITQLKQQIPQADDQTIKNIVDGEMAAGQQSDVGTVSNSNFDFDTHQKYKDAGTITRGVAKGVNSLKQSAIGIHEFIGDSLGADGYRDAMVEAGNKLNREASAIGDRNEYLTRNWEGAVSSIVSQTPGLAVSVLSGGSIPLLMMGAQQFGSDYHDGRAAGLDMQDATTRAGINGIAEIIGEKIGMRSFLKTFKDFTSGAPTKDLIKRLAEHVAKEIPGEELTTAIQFANDKFTSYGQNKQDTLQNYLQQAADTLVQTVMQAGAMGSAGIVKNAAQHRSEQSATVSADVARANTLDQWGKGFSGNAPVDSPNSVQLSAPTPNRIQRMKQAIAARKDAVRGNLGIQAKDNGAQIPPAEAINQDQLLSELGSQSIDAAELLNEPGATNGATGQQDAALANDGSAAAGNQPAGSAPAEVARGSGDAVPDGNGSPQGSMGTAGPADSAGVGAPDSTVAIDSAAHEAATSPVNNAKKAGDTNGSQKRKGTSRREQDKPLQNLDQHQGQVQQYEESVLPQLRRKRDSDVSGVGSEFSGIQGGGGSAPESASHVGQEGQQRELPDRQHAVGNKEGTGAQHAQEQAAHIQRQDSNADGVGRGNWTGSVNPAIPAQAGRDVSRASSDNSTQDGQKTGKQTLAQQIKAEMAAKNKTIPLSIGSTPKNADPITVKNGVIHIGKYTAPHFETGEDITVPEGADNATIAKALRDAGAGRARQKIFGVEKASKTAGSPIAQQIKKDAAARKKKAEITTPGEFGDQARKTFIRSIKDMGGIGIAEARDISGEPAHLANRMAPGLFRKNGNALDLVARHLHELGYLSDAHYNGVDGGVQAVRDLVGQALAREPVMTPEEEQRYAELSMREQEQAADMPAAGEALADMADDNASEEDALALLDDEGLPDMDAAGTMSEADAMRALGFTEEEINAELKPKGQHTQAAEGTAAGAAQEGTRSGSDKTSDAGFALASQTPAEIAAAAKDAKAKADAKAKEDAADEAKVKADSERDSFILSGSSRVADANPNQNDIFSQTASEPKSEVDNFIESHQESFVKIKGSSDLYVKSEDGLSMWPVRKEDQKNGVLTKSKDEVLRQIYDRFVAKQPNSFSKIAADSIENLRKQDVKRALDKTPATLTKEAAKESLPKEPWQMTVAEYEAKHGKPRKGATSYSENTAHKNAVATAVNRGLKVPQEVLADYPDLSPATQLAKATPVKDSAPVSNEPILTASGKPFVTQGTAEFGLKARKLGETHHVVPVEGGFAIVSKESNQAGKFIAAPDGSINFGEITADQSKYMHRQAGNIRLEQGDAKYGLQHIEDRHGDQIRDIGYDSVAQFVYDATHNIEAIWKPESTTQLVVIQSRGKGKAVFIELKPSENGDFYTVNTAFPVTDRYAERKSGWKLLWGGSSVPTDASGANPLAVSPPNAGAATTMTPGQSSDPNIANKNNNGNAPSPEYDKATLENFGEQVTGHRDSYRKAYGDKMGMAIAEDVAAVPLSKSWPEPDYARLLEGGSDLWGVAFIHAARDEIPSKPAVAWKLKRWVEQVKQLRDMANSILSGDVSATAIKQVLDEDKFHMLRDSVGGRADLYEAVGHAKSLKGITVSSGQYGILEGKEYNPPKVFWSVQQKAKATAFSNWPRMLSFAETREAAIATFKQKIDGLELDKPADKTVSFDLYSYRGKPGVWIGKKVGKGYIDLKRFDDTKAARAYLADNQAELEALLAKKKEVPNERRDRNLPRVGADHRNGQDVTPEMFNEMFGFKGVRFGDTMPNSERITNLNQTYDALMDMAGVIGIPPKALSLNGELNIAFGALGTGGKKAAAAHYEPDTVVINLTRKNGPGSLAHEWFHAVDNYFSRMRGKKSAFTTEALDVSLASRDAEFMDNTAVRKEMIGAFGVLVKAINTGNFIARSKALDALRSKPYWSTRPEMAARTFESYVIAKLQDQGASNDYLANIVSKEYWDAKEALGMEGAGTYPYPTAEEIPSVRAAFDNFFNVVETKETDTGMSLNQESTPYNKDIRSAAWKILAGDMDMFQNPTPDSFDMESAAREINPNMRALADKPDLDEQKTGITKKWLVSMPDKTHAFVYENDKNEVWLDASRLGEGISGGTKLYQLVGSYAEANGKVFIGDPAGLSDVALLRRTENMLSLALRYGKTDFMQPHEYQMNPPEKLNSKLANVVRPINWVPGDDENNLKELIKTSYTNTLKLAPEIKDVTYNFDKQRFELDGREFNGEDFKRVTDRIRDDYNAGGLARVVAHAGAIARGEGEVSQPASGRMVGQVPRDGQGRAGDSRRMGAGSENGAAPVHAEAGDRNNATDNGRVAAQSSATQSGSIIGSATLKRVALTNTMAREARSGRGRQLLAQISGIIRGGLKGTPIAGSLYSPTANYGNIADPSDPSYTDPYDHIETRDGTKPAQLAAGRAALAAVETRILGKHAGRNGVTVLASGISADFRASGGTSLVGQEAKTPEQLATVAQVLRDPRFETFRVIYTDKNGQILGESVYSSRLPGAVYMHENMQYQVAKDKARFGASGYWMLHNHPAGAATPSMEDLLLTERTAAKVHGFLGHVIIDHNEYGHIFIDKAGLATGDVIKAPQLAGMDMQANPEVSHPILGAKIQTPEALANLSKQLQIKDGYVTIIGTDAQGRVALAVEVPAASLRKIKNTTYGRLQAAAMLKRATRETGSMKLFAIVPGHPLDYPSLLNAGVLQDVVSAENGYSAADYRIMRTGKLPVTRLEKSGGKSRVGQIASEYRTKQTGTPYGSPPSTQTPPQQTPPTGGVSTSGLDSAKAAAFTAYAGLGTDLVDAKTTLADAKHVTGLRLGLGIETNLALPEDVPMRFNMERRVVEINTSLAIGRAEAAQYMAEEIMHAVDVIAPGRTLSAGSKRLDPATGDIALEAQANFAGGDTYSNYLEYPFHPRHGASPDRMRAELFARLAVLYFGQPDRMRQSLPIAYGAYDEIFRIRIDPVMGEISRSIRGVTGRPGAPRSQPGAGTQPRPGGEGRAGDGDRAELGRLRDTISKTFRADRLGKRANLDYLNTQQTPPSGGVSVSSIPQETKFRKAQRIYQDQLNRFTVIQDWLKENGVKLTERQDVYRAEERMYGKIAGQIEDFRKERMMPLIEKSHKAGFNMHQIGEYLVANHAEERNAQIARINQNAVDGYGKPNGSGMTDAEAGEILNRYASMPKADEFRAMAEYFRSITDDTKQTLLDAGIISKEMSDAWDAAYKSYVPLRGAPAEPTQGQATGKGLSVNSRGERRRALGHRARDEWVVENIIHARERAIYLAEKNRVGQHLAALVAAVPNPDLWTIDKPVKRQVLRPGQVSFAVEDRGIQIASFDSRKEADLFIMSAVKNTNKSPSNFVVNKTVGDPFVISMASGSLADNEVQIYVKGNAVRIQLNDPLLARAYKKMGQTHLEGVLALGRQVNTFLSKAYTGLNPEFIITNIQRDLISGVVNVTGEHGAIVAAKTLKNWIPSLRDMLRYSMSGKANQWVKAYREDGGNTGAAYLGDLERIGQDVQTAYDEAVGVRQLFKENKPGRAVTVALRKSVHLVTAWIEHMNSAAENGMRVALYRSMIESGKSRNQAAAAAKNSTVNFNRKGEIGSQLSALYLFANASIQGTASMAHALAKGEHKGQAWAMMGALTGLAYLLALGYGDDDEWDEIPQYEKDRNMLIKVGDKVVKIAVPYGHGIAFALGNAIYDLQRGKDITEQSYHLASSLLDNMAPLDPLGDKPDMKYALQEITPFEPLRIFSRVANNTSGLGRQIMPESKFDENRPDFLQEYRSTRGSVYEGITRGMSKATGGTATQAGSIDVSPETLKFLWGSATGGTGRFFMDTVQAAHLATKGELPELQATPMVRKFVRDTNRLSDARSRFWDSINKADAVAHDVDRAARGNDKAAVGKFDGMEIGGLSKVVTTYKDVSKYARDLIDATNAMDNKTPAEKRLMVFEIEKKERDFYRRAVKDLNKRIGEK